jgi:hypothetical protein
MTSKRKRKPRPKPHRAEIVMPMDEAIALARAMLGDHFDSSAASRGVARIQAAKEWLSDDE